MGECKLRAIPLYFPIACHCLLQLILTMNIFAEFRASEVGKLYFHSNLFNYYITTGYLLFYLPLSSFYLIHTLSNIFSPFFASHYSSPALILSHYPLLSSLHSLLAHTKMLQTSGLGVRPFHSLSTTLAPLTAKRSKKCGRSPAWCLFTRVTDPWGVSQAQKKHHTDLNTSIIYLCTNDTV